MNTTAIGRQAEEAVADFLSRQGYFVKTRNWRNKYCEIDIIASKNKTIFFIEVKYRTSTNQGGGLDYITHKKQQQMRLAVEMWCAENNWSGDVGLLAVAVSFDGRDFLIDDPVDVY